MKESLISDFNSIISPLTLRFSDSTYEAQYTKFRQGNSPDSGYTKIMIWSTILLLLARTIEVLLFCLLDVAYLGTTGGLIQPLVTALLFSCLLLELLFRYLVPALSGTGIMTVCFFLVFAMGHCVSGDRPGISQSAVLLLPFSLFIGDRYTYSWISGGVVSVVGIGFGIVMVHCTGYLWYELLYTDLEMAAALCVFVSSGYTCEMARRLHFFAIHRQHQAHHLYKGLLKQMPAGLIVMSAEGNIKFVNNLISDIMPRQTQSAAKSTTEVDGILIGNSSHCIVTRSESPPPREADARIILDSIRATEIAARPSLWDFLQNGTGAVLLTETIKFSYSNNNRDYFFSVKTFNTHFKQEDCRAIIFHDETPLHDMSHLEESHQKLFIASVVHDMRTPLQGIVGALEALNTPLRTPDERQYIEIGQNTCKILDFLTHDITDLAQMQAGKLSTSKEVFSPAEAARDCIRILSFSYRQRGIGLDLLQQGERRAFSDRNRYMQILLNLLGNAYKFTPRGGRVTVTLGLDPDNDLLITEVKDTGIGIAEDEIPHLFKLFGKLQSSSAINPRGVGLGLTICKNLSEILGGSIAVHSEVGHGATFVFTIRANSDRCDSLEFTEGLSEEFRPAPQQPEQHVFSVNRNKFDSPSNASQTCARKPQQMRGLLAQCSCPQVLVADDSSEIVLTIRAYARGMGVSIDEADNGRDAVDKVRLRARSPCCRSYAIIFMDINMPVMDGIEAASTITARAEEWGIPRPNIVALTGDELSPEDQERLRDVAGFVAYCVKPMSKKLFAEMLRVYGGSACTKTQVPL